MKRVARYAPAWPRLPWPRLPAPAVWSFDLLAPIDIDPTIGELIARTHERIMSAYGIPLAMLEPAPNCRCYLPSGEALEAAASHADAQDPDDT